MEYRKSWQAWLLKGNGCFCGVELPKSKKQKTKTVVEGQFSPKSKYNEIRMMNPMFLHTTWLSFKKQIQTSKGFFVLRSQDEPQESI